MTRHISLFFCKSTEPIPCVFSFFRSFFLCIIAAARTRSNSSLQTMVQLGNNSYEWILYKGYKGIRCLRQNFLQKINSSKLKKFVAFSGLLVLITNPVIIIICQTNMKAVYVNVYLKSNWLNIFYICNSFRLVCIKTQIVSVNYSLNILCCRIMPNSLFFPFTKVYCWWEDKAFFHVFRPLFPLLSHDEHFPCDVEIQITLPRKRGF